jgi:hypothetical protein
MLSGGLARGLSLPADPLITRIGQNAHALVTELLILACDFSAAVIVLHGH